MILFFFFFVEWKLSLRVSSTRELYWQAYTATPKELNQRKKKNKEKPNKQQQHKQNQRHWTETKLHRRQDINAHNRSRPLPSNSS